MQQAIARDAEQYLTDNVDAPLQTYRNTMANLDRLTGHGTPMQSADGLMQAAAQLPQHVARMAVEPQDALELPEVEAQLQGGRKLLQSYLNGVDWTRTRMGEATGSPGEVQAAAKVAMTALNQVQANLDPQTVEEQVIMPNAERYLS